MGSVRPAAVVLLALVLVGCGSTASPSGLPSGSSTAGTSPLAPDVGSAAAASAPATPAPSRSQEEIRAAAAKAYRVAVIPANRTSSQLEKAYRNKTSLADSKVYCKKLADSQHTFLVALKAIVWPTDTAADAKVLIRNIAGEEANLRTCAKARTIAIWNDAWTDFGKAATRAHEAANLVRLDLGLNPVPG